MSDAAEPKGYPIHLTFYRRGRIEIEVPVCPALYAGKTAKSFSGMLEPKGLSQLKELGGNDRLYVNATLDRGFYDGAREKIEVRIALGLSIDELRRYRG